MNRCAKCMKMLQLLKARGTMSREELAVELQTNVRNLVEYRKELEEAGYPIESLTGRYGGYRLLSENYLPVLKLNEDEQRALSDAYHYLHVQSDFLSLNEFTSAMDKIRVQLENGNADNIYMRKQQPFINDEIRDWIRLCEQAIREKRAVRIRYKGMKDQQIKQFVMHPYEILHYQSAYYCLAYSLSAKDFRNFKFSKERMKELILLDNTFTRDRDFKIKDHVGTLGLMKDDLHEFEVLITGNQALLVAEKALGLHPQMVWKDKQILYLKTIMEGKMNVISFILSLGDQAEVLAPAYLRQEIQDIIYKMYEKSTR